jgi:hypothetical protein
MCKKRHYDGCSPVQGVLPTVYKIYELKKKNVQGPIKGRRVIIIIQLN